MELCVAFITSGDVPLSKRTPEAVLAVLKTFEEDREDIRFVETHGSEAVIFLLGALSIDDASRLILDTLQTHFNGRFTVSAQPYSLVAEMIKKVETDDSRWTHYGAILHEEGHHEKALGYYERALSMNPRSYDAWFKKGLALQDTDKFEEARKAFAKAIDLRPDKGEGWYHIGLCLVSEGKPKEALEAFDRALKLGVSIEAVGGIGLDQVHLEKGMVLQTLNRYEDALVSIEQSIKISDGAKAEVKKGELLVNLGRYDEALTVLETVAGKAGTYEGEDRQQFDEVAGNLWKARGISKYNKGEYLSAIEDFNRVLEENREDADAWTRIGDSLRHLNRFPEALQCYDKALDLDHVNSQAMFGKAEILKALERSDEALELLDQAITHEKGSAKAWQRRGTLLKEMGHIEEALTRQCFGPSRP
jgi:tetratricopeptide (TPR) repeat protein